MDNEKKINNIGLKFKRKKSILLILFLSFIGLFSFAEEMSPNKMENNSFNFYKLNDKNEKKHLHLWEKFNNDFYQNHPEFGFLAFNAPCNECVEDISKRTKNERYFLDINNPSIFYKQTGYGDIHHWDGNYWLTINHQLQFSKDKGYHSPYFANPLYFNLDENHVEIEYDGERLKFNDWTLYKTLQNETQFIYKADWSNLSAGNDGIFVENIFPGIDGEFIVMRGKIKTNFIVNNVDAIGSFDELIFRDSFNLKNGKNVKTKHPFDSNTKKFVGSFHILDEENNEIAVYGEGLAYAKNNSKNISSSLVYELNNDYVDIFVPNDWLISHLASSPIVIDPVVTGSNSLAQAAITGSQYNASCGFDNSCDHNLTVQIPANATFSDVAWSFTYLAQGLC